MYTRRRNERSAERAVDPPVMTTASDKDEKIPLFLMKLWKIVDDPALTSIVSWDESGFSFHIHDPYRFCKNVLPQYFKHNNLNSLIRQLNMYGFRKITPIERTGLTRAESDHEHLEFSHAYFIRGHDELLSQIKRKSYSLSRGPAAGHELTMSSTAIDDAYNDRPLAQVLDEVRQLRDRQIVMDNRLQSVLKENQQLWREVGQMRTLHAKQQQVVNKLISFLLNVVQPATNTKRLVKSNILAIRDGPCATHSDAALFMSHADDMLPSSSSAAMMGGGVPGKRVINFDKTTLDALDALQSELHRPSTGNFETPNSNGSNARGMTITDVTDEFDDVAGLAISSSLEDAPLSAASMASSPGWADTLTAAIDDNPMLATPNEYSGGLVRAATTQPYTYTAAAIPLSPLLQQPPSPTFRHELSDFLTNVDLSLDNYRDTLMHYGGSGSNNNVQPTTSAVSPLPQFDADALRELFTLCEQEGNERDQQEALTATEAAMNVTSNQVAIYQQPPLAKFQLAPFKTDDNRTPDANDQSTTAGVDDKFLQTPVLSPALVPRKRARK